MVIAALGTSWLFVAHASVAGSKPPVFRNARHQFTFVQPEEAPPDVAVADLAGRETRLEKWRGKLVVVAFWASWCGPCLGEMPALERLAATADPDQVIVAAVALDGIDAEGLRRLADQRGWSHIKFLRDPGQRLGAITRRGVDLGALPLYGLPTTYVLKPSGAVAGDIVGPSDWTSPQAHDLLAYLARP